MKPLWKVTFTYISIYGLRAYGRAYKPEVETKVYRRRWRARLAAWVGELPVPTSPICCFTKLEPYWPNSNVVPLRAA